MRIIQLAFDVVAVIGALIGAALIRSSFVMETSAPQQAALAAIGIGFAVIPYCVSGVLHRAGVRKEMRRRYLVD